MNAPAEADTALEYLIHFFGEVSFHACSRLLDQMHERRQGLQPGLDEGETGRLEIEEKEVLDLIEKETGALLARISGPRPKDGDTGFLAAELITKMQTWTGLSGEAREEFYRSTFSDEERETIDTNPLLVYVVEFTNETVRHCYECLEKRAAGKQMEFAREQVLELIKVETRELVRQRRSNAPKFVWPLLRLGGRLW